MRGLAGLVMLLSLFGCGDDDVRQDDNKKKPEPEPMTQTVFVADGEPSAPAISLRLASIDDTRVTFDVVGHGIDDMYGVAFRLQTDPAQLEMLSFTATTAIHDAKLQAPGLGLYVATAVGQSPGISVDGAVVGQITLDRVAALRKADHALRFVTPRSAVITSQGEPLSGVSWIGGALRLETL